MTDVDFIIVGQGLAGTCLAWELLARGASVRVIDREAAVTSSRIAAGLITPVTGQRLVKTWRFEELRAAAWEFYRRVESELDCSLLRDTPMARVFVTEREREYFGKRMWDSAYAGLLREMTAFPVGVWAPLGGCELLQGGQLDVAEFLSKSRRVWVREGRYVAGELSLPGDVQLLRDRIELPCWGLRARALLFCEGIAARSNPWFSNIEFKPARGEMLTVEIADWNETRIVHGGVWIAPLGPQGVQNNLFRVGATYDWDQLDSGPTAEGRSSLIASLEQLLHRPYKIVDHQSAVRPILQQVNPVIGVHPRYPQLGYFNGLASKGSLQAPFCARQLASHLVQQTPLEREVDLLFRVPWPGCPS